MEVSAVTLWLIAGAVLVAIEVLVFPTIVLAFAGLGAITTGLLLNFQIVQTIPNQIAAFFISTVVWAVILWAPLKAWHHSEDTGYDDMVGHTATVGEGGMTKGKKGEVVWSGSIWNARLSSDCSSGKLDGGADVTILKVEKGVLIVAPSDEVPGV